MNWPRRSGDLEHPEITNALQTGWPDRRGEPPAVKCPVCGGEPDTIYVTPKGEKVGCELCLSPRPYYEFTEEEM